MWELQKVAAEVELIDDDSDIEVLEKGDKITRYLDINNGLHTKVQSIIQNIEMKMETMIATPKMSTPKKNPRALEEELMRLHRRCVK